MRSPDEIIIPIVAIGCIFGGPVLWGIAHCIATNWRRAQIAKAELALKRAMVERGYSVEEIARVMGTPVAEADKMAEKAV